MVDQAENEGGLDQHESDLIRNAIEFNDLEVSEILTPAWIWWLYLTPPPWSRRPSLCGERLLPPPHLPRQHRQHRRRHP
ncbi:MAG: hypothetical protein ACLR0P_04735 [Oscillospiraceae bacterium]